MAYYIFNASRDSALRQMRQRRWAVAAGERHRDALAAGDLVLIYLGAPESAFIGRARLASSVDAHGDVAFAEVEEWNPPVPMRDDRRLRIRGRAQRRVSVTPAATNTTPPRARTR